MRPLWQVTVGPRLTALPCKQTPLAQERAVSGKEATARIKINRLLEAAGRRFFADGAEPASRPSVTRCSTA